MTDDAAPELFLIGLAALNLISDSAAEQPLVLVIDDAHWLDQPSAEVLGFMARRLESEAVVMLAAQRDGFPPVLTGADAGGATPGTPGPSLRRAGALAPGTAARLDPAGAATGRGRGQSSSADGAASGGCARRPDTPRR